MPSIKEQTVWAVKQLKECLDAGDISPFFAGLRQSDLLQIPLTYGNDLKAAYRSCATILHAIGTHSVGAAYALENHFLILIAAQTYLSVCPMDDLQRFLTRVRESRLLVANTRAANHSNAAFSEGAKATVNGGGYVINGCASFVSLANLADVLWLQVGVNNGSGIFLIDLANQNSIRSGELSFPHAMPESETRSLSFHETKVHGYQRLGVPNADLLPQGKLVAAQELWHNTLISAQFLGGAAGALEELSIFVKDMKSWGGKPFRQLENVLSEVGRLGMRYAAARLITENMGAVVDQLRNHESYEEWLKGAVFAAKAANWNVTDAVETIITGCRRLMGTRVFGGGSRLERLSIQAMIGPLVPRGNALLEMEYGRYFLEQFSTDNLTVLGRGENN